MTVTTEDLGLVERLTSLKKSGQYHRIVEAIPYARFMGLSLDDQSGDLIGKLSYSDHLIGNPALPALHGGTLGALLELTAAFKLLWEQETVVLPKTVSLTVQYLRSGRPVDTFARAVITKHGRRVVNVRTEAWQEDQARPIAIAYAHFLILPGDE